MNVTKKALDTLPLHPPAADSGPPRRALLEGPTSTARPLTPLDSEAGNLSVGRLWNAFKQHWLMFLVMGTFVGCGFAWAAWSVIPSKYTTYALLRVSSSEPFYMYPPAGQPGRTDFSTYLKTQAQLIKSHVVLLAALRDQSISELPTLREQVDPVKYLEENLKVEYTEGNELVKISLDGENPTEIKAIVDAVKNAFFKEVVEDDLQRRQSRLTRLEELKIKLQNQLESKTKEEAVPVVVDGAKALLSGLPQGVRQQWLHSEMTAAKNLVAKLDFDIEQLSAQIEVTQRRIDKLKAEPPTVANLKELIEAEPKYVEYQQQVQRASKRIEQLKSISNNHDAPAFEPLKKDLADAIAQRDKYRADREKEILSKQAQPQIEKLTNDLDEMRSRLAALKNAKVKAAEELARTQDELAKIKPEVESLNVDKVDISLRQEKLQKIIDIEQQLRLEAEAPSRVRSVQNASLPLKKEMKKQVLGSAMAGLFGFALVGVGLLTLELRKQRVYTLNDVKQVSDWPVVGVVPWAVDLPLAGEMGKYTTRAEILSVNEAVDKTRAIVLRDFQPGRAKTILVGSAVSDEGKSFLAWQLAASISRTGARTLLIDFDLRTPTQHEFLQVPNSNGVCEVLQGSVELRQAIHTFSNGLAFLPAGNWTDRIREDLVGDRPVELFQKVKETYDVIVVHSHAFLPVTDSVILTEHADVYLQAVLRNESVLPMIQRTQERVADCGVPECGVVYLGASADECLY